MIAEIMKTIASTVLVALATASCTSFYEVPIETPIQSKLDVSAFSRVLVAGFVAGGLEDIDVNRETVRLLRSQLRNNSDLEVLEADILALDEIVVSQANANKNETEFQPEQLPEEINSERDLELFERIFSNTDYWRRLGEEHQNPLIVTGTVLFTPHSRSGFVTREQETYDSFGRRQVVPVRTYTERRGFILRPKFIFIDGRTGATLYSESFREEILYNISRNTSPLSSYFELADRLLPNFLSTLSSQKINGTRTLLR